MTAVIWRKSWSLFNMLYIEKRYTQKKISDKISVTKITFFSKELQHSSQYSFNFQFFYDWKQKVHQFLKSLRGVSIFYSIWVLLKFIFALREYKKTVNLLKKEKKINWDSIHARLNRVDIQSTRYRVTRKRLKHPEKNIQLLGVCWF